jgi:hypothetical protein
MINFGLNYLVKILTLLGIGTSAILKTPYLNFDPSSATAPGNMVHAEDGCHVEKMVKIAAACFVLCAYI